MVNMDDKYSNHNSGPSLAEQLDCGTFGSKEVLDILYEMSSVLNTKLDIGTLAVCFRLIESGVNAEALANVIRVVKSSK